MAGWMSKGMQEAYEHLSEGGGKRNSLFLPEFWLTEKEKGVLIQIVDSETVNLYIHRISRVSKNGKPYSVSKTCSQEEDCYYCECAQAGMKTVSPASWMAHLTILDSRLWPYSKGEEEIDDPAPWTRRLWRASAKRIVPLTQLRGIQKRGRLDKAFLLVSRSGSGTQTQYSFEYLTKGSLAGDGEFEDVVSKLGWNPVETPWAPCPEFSDGKVVPLNYEDILKPDTYEEASAFIGSSARKKLKDEDEEDGDAEDFKRTVRRGK